MTTLAIALCIAVGGIDPGMLPSAPLAAREQSERRPGRFRANDKELREWATTSPPPAYPRASLEKKISGVVVAAIRIDPGGSPEAVEILQAPDPATRSAAHDALVQWRFKPPFGNGGEGLIVFYFHMKGSTGSVLSPAQMGEVTNPGARKMARADEPPLKPITEPEFRALSTQLRPVVLDIRDRETFAEGHEKGAVNIPFMEVLTRAAAELPVSRPIVIDCHDPPDVCAMAVHWLRSVGFSGQVFILAR